MGAPTRAIEVLERGGIAHRVHRYEHVPSGSSYGEEAAEVLGVEASQVCKTLVASVGGSLVVAVVPVNTSLDLKALASAMGEKKAQMADTAEAERATGYVVGGISPLGQKQSLPTVIDSSVRDLDAVFVSGGRRGLEVELSASDLAALTGGRFAPIGRTQ
jgi:Cys-tRNA(Pro)/Cys-tRNA(Cys) deacylase